MRKASLITLLTFALVSVSTGLFAQVGPPPGPVPLDGGAGVLIALGAAYGVKKLYNSKFSDKKD
jgi:hypothetical protein